MADLVPFGNRIFTTRPSIALKHPFTLISFEKTTKLQQCEMGNESISVFTAKNKWQSMLSKNRRHFKCVARGLMLFLHQQILGPHSRTLYDSKAQCAVLKANHSPSSIFNPFKIVISVLKQQMARMNSLFAMILCRQQNFQILSDIFLTYISSINTLFYQN